MRDVRTRMSPGRRSVLAAVVTGVLAVSGGTLVVGGLHNGPSPQPRQPALARPTTTAPPTPTATPAAKPIPTTVGPVLAPSPPRAIAIPAIDVRSKMQRLGLTAEGVLEVPAPDPRYDQPGWYHDSPTPGAVGPAVIAGHVDSKDGPSVFYRLGSLRPGNRVLVTRADHSVAIFAVDSVRRHRKSHFPTKEVYGNTNFAALRLITCGGPIDGNTGHYRDNVVVFASLVGSR
jgi:Sortase domain